MKIKNEQELRDFTERSMEVLNLVPNNGDPIVGVLTELSKELLGEYSKLLKQHLQALKLIDILVAEGDAHEENCTIGVG